MKLNRNIRLAEVCPSRDNNFNLLRFGAALAVFVSHCPSIVGMEIVSLTRLLGYVGVNAFFAMSGFLVAKSLFTRNNMAQFMGSRVLRIYPALIVAVLYTALGVGLYFSELGISEYLGDPLTREYLLKNTLQLIWPIPVTLPGLGWESVNSPLWTLPFELHMYLLLALAGSLALAFNGVLARYVWTLYFLAVAVASVMYMADYAWGLGGYNLGHQRYYLRFLSMFGIGVALYLARDRVVLDTRYFIALVLLIAIVSPIRPLFVFIAYGSLAYVLLYLAYIPGGPVRRFNKLGDYSYGIYIFGYPTQKTVLQLLPDINAFQLFALSFPITLMIAVASWHLLERPALSLKKSIGVNQS